MDLVRFYACEGDPVAVAARLVAKALARGEALCVCGAAGALQRLSDRLWQSPGFVAHAAPAASESVRRHSRVRLLDQPPAHLPGALVLNLGADLHVESLQARRLLDVVGPTEPERQAARARYRRCQAAGWPTETVRLADA